MSWKPSSENELDPDLEIAAIDFRRSSVAFADISAAAPTESSIVLTPAVPVCERNINFFFKISLLSIPAHDRFWVRWTLPIMSNALIFTGLFTPLFYPNYYINQAEIWTTDLAIIFVVYNYVLWLQRNWSVTSGFENINIRPFRQYITLFFTVLFIIYYFYYATIMFIIHPEPDAAIQFKNILLCMTWYFFFSTAAALYYFICVKLQQRAQALHDWLDETLHTLSNVEDFYKKYNHHYVIIQRFGRYWNFIIFLGIILLTFHIPIDLISIVYDKNYYDIYGFVIKTTSLAWYIYSICHLNDYETRVLPFLYKHRLYSMTDMEMITKYVEYRPLGLPFYGIKINSGFFIKLILLMANLVIPSIYSLVSKNIINISRPV